MFVTFCVLLDSTLRFIGLWIYVHASSNRKIVVHGFIHLFVYGFMCMSLQRGMLCAYLLLALIVL